MLFSKALVRVIEEKDPGAVLGGFLRFLETPYL
jgi:hypothetical protein